MPETLSTEAYRWRWLALVAVLTAEIMDLLDTTIVGIAAPSIRSDIGGNGTTIQWIAAGYTLAFAVGLITGGRLGDLYGRRRMFLVGLIGFVLASTVCGLVVTPEMLITSRVVQGLFAAVLVPQGFGIVKAVFPPDELRSAFGAFGPAIGLATVGGPILAGALIAWDLGGTGWRTVFFVNVPIGLACLVLAWKVLPESRSEDVPRLDPLGMLLVSVGVVLLVFPLVQGRELGWPGWVFVMMTAGVAVVVLFAVHQLRRRAAGRSPLVEPALFSSRAFSAGLVVGLVFFAALAGLLFALGLYLQLGMGFSPLAAGLTQSPWALGTAVGAVVSSAGLGRRYGRPLLQIGAVVMALGIGIVALTLAWTDGVVDGWQLAPGLAVSGVGMGLLITLFFDIVLAGVSLAMVGSASGVLNANQQLGSAAGVAVLGTVFFGVLEDGSGALAAITTVLGAAAGLVLLTAALAFLLPRRLRAEQTA